MKRSMLLVMVVFMMVMVITGCTQKAKVNETLSDVAVVEAYIGERHDVFRSDYADMHIMITEEDGDAWADYYCYDEEGYLAHVGGVDLSYARYIVENYII